VCCVYFVYINTHMHVYIYENVLFIDYAFKYSIYRTYFRNGKNVILFDGRLLLTVSESGCMGNMFAYNITILLTQS